MVYLNAFKEGSAPLQTLTFTIEEPQHLTKGLFYTQRAAAAANQDGQERKKVDFFPKVTAFAFFQSNAD